jgi:predicted nucleic acid-binding protein
MCRRTLKGLRERTARALVVAGILRSRLIADASQPALQQVFERAGHARVAGCRSARWRVTFGTSVIVVDASVLAVALGDDGTDGGSARERLTHEASAARELIDLAVASVWRRHVAARLMTARRADAAVSDLADLPLRRSFYRPLLGRIWALRHFCYSLRRRVRRTAER